MSGPDDAKPWLNAYPSQVPAEIDDARIGTLADLIRDGFSEYAQRPAAESFGKRLTYAELGKAAASITSWFQNKGLVKGDRVAIMLPNVMAYPAVLCGALVGGYVVVNVNPLYTPRELIHQLNDAKPRALFVLENFAGVVEAALPDLDIPHIVIVKPGDLLGFKGMIVDAVSRYVKKSVKPFSLPSATTFRSVISQGSRRRPHPVTVTGDDLAFLQYTGGTTGIAKGAMLLHRNMAANVVQIEAWIRPFIGESRHVMVTALPLYHIFALTACGLFMMKIGACQLLILNPRDIPAFVKILKSRPFTLICGVNTLYNALSRAKGIGEVDFSKLVFSISGGMATQASVAKAWKKLTGRPIIEGYGLSETSPVVCVNRLDIEEFSGTIGYPMPSTDLSIRSAEGDEMPSGEPGELCVKGPQVMAGYWNKPEETAQAMTPDGFFRTGDVASMAPDGQVKIVDRLKDMILVSGFNVYPNEIEGVLAGHPGILEAAIIGIPDMHSGEAVAAFVVKKDSALTRRDLRAYCKAHLTSYKLPRRIEFREALPKTNVGKVSRRELKEETSRLSSEDDRSERSEG